MRITATAAVDIATSNAVGVSRNISAIGVTRNTNGEANTPNKQTDIQPTVYLKLNIRFLDSLPTWIANATETIAISIAKTV